MPPGVRVRLETCGACYGGLVRALVLVAAALILGCSDPPKTQYLPIGSRCTSPGQCGTMPFDCNTAGFPGGYCTLACTTDGDCPLDALCAHDHACRRKCSIASDCRSGEGYTCAPLTTSTSVCVPGSGSAVDLGRPAG